MDGWLKQSTSIEVKVGPFVSSADGVTPQTSLTITSSEVLLSKNEGDWAAKNESTSLVHESNGFYRCLLNTTDTNTLALLRYQIAESGCLPVWGSFLVVPANVYDSFFSTDLLQVDLAQWLGSVPSTLSGSSVRSSVQDIVTGAIGSTSFSTEIGLKTIQSGVCDGAAAGSITLNGSASSVNDFYKGARIHLTASTGTGQSRLCVAYNGSTKVATVEPNWTTNPQAFSTEYAIRSDSSATLNIATGGIIAASFAAGAIDAAAIAAGAIDDDAVATDMDSYSAKIGLLDDDGGTADRYEVAWFKNGNWITSGITSPTIQVVKSSDGTNLFAATAMTEIGSLHLFKKTESTDRIVDGASYWAIARATIDGSTREWPQVVGRDST